MNPDKILAAIFTGDPVTPPDGADTPVDLKAVPRDRWEEFLCFPLVLPPDVEKYVAGLEGPATVTEKDHIEESVMTFHGITAPYAAVFRNGRARLMRE